MQNFRISFVSNSNINVAISENTYRDVFHYAELLEIGTLGTSLKTHLVDLFNVLPALVYGLLGREEGLGLGGQRGMLHRSPEVDQF